MNLWQGEFPDLNTVDDGFEYTNPVIYLNKRFLWIKCITFFIHEG